MEDGSADAWLSKGASSLLLHDENIVGLLPRGATWRKRIYSHGM